MGILSSRYTDCHDNLLKRKNHFPTKQVLSLVRDQTWYLNTAFEKSSTRGKSSINNKGLIIWISTQIQIIFNVSISDFLFIIQKGSSNSLHTAK